MFFFCQFILTKIIISHGQNWIAIFEVFCDSIWGYEIDLIFWLIQFDHLQILHQSRTCKTDWIIRNHEVLPSAVTRHYGIQDCSAVGCLLSHELWSSLRSGSCSHYLELDFKVWSFDVSLCAECWFSETRFLLFFCITIGHNAKFTEFQKWLKSHCARIDRQNWWGS